MILELEHAVRAIERAWLIARSAKCASPPTDFQAAVGGFLNLPDVAKFEADLDRLLPRARPRYDRRVDYIPDEIAAARIGRWILAI